MLTPSLHEHQREDERLVLLSSFQILDTPAEAGFDDIVRLAAAQARAPIALISLVDRYRQWCKAQVGLDIREMPRDQSFCGHAILGTGPFVIEDAPADPRFRGSALVTGPAGVRAYAGVPLDPTENGLPLGTLCVMDRMPRRFDPHELEVLHLMATLVVRLLESRRTIARLQETLAATRIEESELRERERRASEEKFRVLFEHSSDAHMIFDETGIIDCNNAAVAMLRCRDKQEVLSLHPAQLSPELQPDGRRSMEKCIEMDARARAQGHHRFDWVHRNLDGEDFPVEVTLTPVTLSSRPALLVVWHDLTERKRTEDDLRRAKEAAETAARAKADFLATMSHELRTPMNGVIGMTALLLNTPLSDQQRGYAHTVRLCSESLLALINDILDFSRLEAGKIELERVAFSPRALVADTLAVVSASAEAKGIRLSGQVRLDVPQQLVGDPARLRQILLNLIANAVKFTHQGEVVVTAESAGLDAAGRVLLRLLVRDTGIGIPPEAQGRLFQAFSQVDSSTTRKYGGTGLGLAICRRLSLAMGGSIEVTSQVGQGSRFTLTLPLPMEIPVARPPLPQLSGPVRAPLQPDARSWELRPLGRPYRVLVVDDNGVNRVVIAAMLDKLCCVPSVAESGEEALGVLSGKRFDVVLMDCNMPGMDGFELTRAIRQREAAERHTPIVALTANALPGDRELCLEAGMDDYLTKPVTIEALRRAIERCGEAAATPRA